MILATDLDRTLLPNGPASYQEKSIEQLFSALAGHDYKLVYVTGRNLGLVLEAVEKYHIPIPDFLIAEVGSRIHVKSTDGTLKDYGAWSNHLKASNPHWGRDVITDRLSANDALELQEGWKQNEYKISYYLVEQSRRDEIIQAIDDTLAELNVEAGITYSVDPIQNVGLIDIMPVNVNKLTALEFVRQELDHQREEVVFCGDSGNDIVALTAGYKAVAVKNTPEPVKRQLLDIAEKKDICDLLYIASGDKQLNGNYAAGIIEGLKHFGVIN